MFQIYITPKNAWQSYCKNKKKKGGNDVDDYGHAL